ncbi:MAG: hydantoinase/oxoprolinase family protein, partial [Proteobacteria bacterium]|nr:hydantoinase/oxoprolinase family protein [Pseudomonadota bacterium]
MVVLGYLNPRALAGGSVALAPERARRAILDTVAAPLGLSALDAAFGVYTIACANMTRAVKAVTTYRGRDPRDFVLFAFGGNGPVAAVEVARALDMTTVLVPPAPGVFSALGLLFSDAEQEFAATVSRGLASLDDGEIAAAFDRLAQQGRAALAADGHAPERISVHRLADLRYSGQAYELSIPVPDGAPTRADLLARFGAEHERQYGHRSDSDPVDLMTVRVTARARVAGPSRYDPAAIVAGVGVRNGGAAEAARACYFGPRHGVVPTPILARAALAGRTVEGPAVIEEYDATCVLPPGAAATLDASGNIAITLG